MASNSLEANRHLRRVYVYIVVRPREHVFSMFLMARLFSIETTIHISPSELTSSPLNPALVQKTEAKMRQAASRYEARVHSRLFAKLSFGYLMLMLTLRPSACGLCQRIGRICDYSADNQLQLPSPEDFAALQQQVADLHHLITSNNGMNNGNGIANGNGFTNGSEPHKNGAHISTPSNTMSGASPGSWPGPTSFPSLFFLDSNAFEYERFQIQAPYIKVPPGALTALGNSTELREMIEYYFSTVHTYFPVISKIRLYQHLANPLHEPGAGKL